MAAATASASSGSSGWPAFSVSLRRLKTAFGSRWRWTAVEKTLPPQS
jgi:hypothetical protein